MKLSAKPISSPGRAEKFPPPLMRFLRTNVGSRSRGRLRSSPMFVRKKSTAIETQEPSSPKVTCMGQVRVRRSSKQVAAKRPRPPTDGAPTRCRCSCSWIRNSLFCHHLPAKIKPKPCQPVWPNWGFFRVGSFRRKPSKAREDSHSTQTESNFRDRCSDESGREYDELEEKEYEERDYANSNANAFVSKSCTPPKNALLLTRCRSAPYRSSSLANRFWGSPLRSEETGEEQRTELENRQHAENEKTTSQRDSVEKESEGKLGFFKELEDSIKERLIKSENIQELKGIERGGGDSVHPLVLTRCKSEPARTAQKLDPEINFWKKRRLGFADSSSPHDL